MTIALESVFANLTGAYAHWDGAGVNKLGGFAPLATGGTAPLIVAGDARQRVTSSAAAGGAGQRGGDVRRCDGITGRIVIPAARVQAILDAGSGAIIFAAKRNTAGSGSAAEQVGFQPASDHNTMIMAFNQRGSGGGFLAPANSLLVYTTNNAGTAASEETYPDDTGVTALGPWPSDGQWHLFMLALDGTKIYTGQDTARSAGTAHSGHIPATASDFWLGGNNSAGSIASPSPWTFGDVMEVVGHVPTAAELRALANALHGRAGGGLYGSSADASGDVTAARFIAAAAGGMDIDDAGDSNQYRSDTQAVAAGQIADGNHDDPRTLNRDQGNVVARVRMLERATGQRCRALTVGANYPGQYSGAYTLGVLNKLVDSAEVPTDAHVLAWDLTKWNRDHAADFSNGNAATGWQQDVGYRGSGTMAESSGAGIILDPRAPRWPFGDYDELEIVMPFARFASGGGTIRPNVVRVRDGAVVTAAVAIACTGSDAWDSVTIPIGRISEAVRFRLQDGTDATHKFAVGPVTVRVRNRARGFTYAVSWAMGGHDIAPMLSSMAVDPATITRRANQLRARRAATGSSVLGVSGQWGQNARASHLKPDNVTPNDAENLAYNDDLTQNALPAYYRAGVASNHHAHRAQMRAIALAAGYSDVYFLYSGYPAVGGGGDYTMEDQNQRALMDAAADDLTGRTLVIDGIETIGELERVQEASGYDAGGVAHLSLAGQDLAGDAQGARLAAAVAANPGGGGGASGNTRSMGMITSRVRESQRVLAAGTGTAPATPASLVLAGSGEPAALVGAIAGGQYVDWSESGPARPTRLRLSALVGDFAGTPSVTLPVYGVRREKGGAVLEKLADATFTFATSDADVPQSMNGVGACSSPSSCGVSPDTGFSGEGGLTVAGNQRPAVVAISVPERFIGLAILSNNGSAGTSVYPVVQRTWE